MAEREMKKKNQYEHLIRTMAARITNLESGAATADGGNWLHGYQTSSTSATTTTKTIQIDTHQLHTNIIQLREFNYRIF